MANATGTEYVNAQMMELKTKIDKLAGELHGTTMGLVYTDLFTAQCAYVQVALTSDIYNGQIRCRLSFSGVQWNGSESYKDQTVEYYGSMSVSKNNAIPETYRPSETLQHSQNISWQGGDRGGGTVNIEVSTTGRIQVGITGSGYFNYTFTYYE